MHSQLGIRRLELEAHKEDFSVKTTLFPVLLTALLVISAACSTAPQEEAATPPPAAEEASPMEGDHIATGAGDLIVHPISHATFVMSWNGQTIYVDPVGGAEAFEGLPAPDLILVTDVHGDHLNAETLEAVMGPETAMVAPAAVAEELPEDLAERVETLANGEETTVSGVSVEAVPMYNLTQDRLQYHAKGRGNGYVVTLADARVYISGDTEDIPEMRALEDIDAAFVCFNLPYTMTEGQAADAVLEFAPAVVYPYHFRGSDAEKFASLVREGGSSEVRILGWY